MQIRKLQFSLPLYLLTAIAITWLGFGIRLHNLGGDSLWLDEQLTLQTARLGFPDVLTGARDHPPMIYVLTSMAIRQFGESEFSARLVSLFAGTLAVPLIFLFGKVMQRSNAGLWAALFLAFSPFHLKYSQESRHYALLMLASLATYILLYLALARPKIRYWIGFGIFTALNLYIHYGAFMVLASQIVLISIWMVWQIIKRNYNIIWYPFLAALVAFLLFGPWIPNFWASLGFNVGDATISDTGGIAPIAEWIREAFYKFGMYFEYLPYLILILATLGLLLLLWQREFLILGLLLSGILLPFIFIQVGNVARGSYSRYIIYILPLYLFAAAVTPAAIVTYLRARRGRKLGMALAIAGALFFILLAWGPVRSEHEHIQDDWRGIVQYLDQHAADGDIVLGLSMNFANGFNTISVSMPYYLQKQSVKNLVLLPGNRLDRDSVVTLAQSSGQVWIVLYDREFDQALTDNYGYLAQPFQSRLFVMPDPESGGSTLERVIGVYEELIPYADQPSPSCLLEKDLSLLYAQAGDFITAERRLSNALSACSDILTGSLIKYTLQEDILKIVFQGAVAEYLQQNNVLDARRVAGRLFELDPHNELALETLTQFNLLELFERGEAVVDDEGSLEPVRSTKFLMPQTGDSGDVLFTHPPSSVSFNITLPQEPLFFVSRVAMDPQSWHWGGDGSTFIVTITTEDGQAVELASLHVSKHSQDRHWHDIEASLAPFAGQTVVLTLSSDPGTAGDFSGDWGGWESPRVMILSPK